MFSGKRTEKLAIISGLAVPAAVPGTSIVNAKLTLRRLRTPAGVYTVKVIEARVYEQYAGYSTSRYSSRG